MGLPRLPTALTHNSVPHLCTTVGYVLQKIATIGHVRLDQIMLRFLVQQFYLFAIPHASNSK